MGETMKKHELIEIIFDITYLTFAIFSGIYMLITSNGTNIKELYGLMVLILGLGDSFHLIPRIFNYITKKDLNKFLGFGKFITSISMTIFYLLLYEIYKIDTGITYYQIIIYTLAIIRILLCLLPQNNWLKNTANTKMGLYRNIPFVLMAIIIVFLQFKYPMDTKFKNIPYAIILSFLFYMPVVLFADKYKFIGSLMLPKTLAYVWIIIIGFNI